jgi:3alpha(or 20beta)-hydroxysteroid dehydrogenase
MGTIEELTVDEFREVSNTNLIGVFLGIRAVLPSMRRAGGGSIVNVNSTVGLGVAAGLAAYGTSKWGIRVNGFHPGIIICRSGLKRGA